MIAQIAGKVTYKDIRYIIVSAAGVGYKIFATNDTLIKVSEGDTATLWTYLAVRENSLDLYGFARKEELELFELLITVSGIGPKSALGILSVTTLDTLKTAISSNDTSHLTKVSGIGKKTAEKIVLELKDKFDAHEDDGAGMKSEVDALEALKSIGYAHSEARDALKKIDKSIVSTGEKVKAALKLLGR
jgi:holliday junction DNA helicase RuvA